MQSSLVDVIQRESKRHLRAQKHASQCQRPERTASLLLGVLKHHSDSDEDLDGDASEAESQEDEELKLCQRPAAKSVLPQQRTLSSQYIDTHHSIHIPAVAHTRAASTDQLAQHHSHHIQGQSIQISLQARLQSRGTAPPWPTHSIRMDGELKSQQSHVSTPYVANACQSSSHPSSGEALPSSRTSPWNDQNLQLSRHIHPTSNLQAKDPPDAASDLEAARASRSFNHNPNSRLSCQDQANAFDAALRHSMNSSKCFKTNFRAKRRAVPSSTGIFAVPSKKVHVLGLATKDAAKLVTAPRQRLVQRCDHYADGRGEWDGESMGLELKGEADAWEGVGTVTMGFD